MSEVAIVDSDPFKKIEEVAALAVEGKTEYQIARTLGIKVVEAKSRLEQWHEMLRNNRTASDTAADYLDRMVVHYDRLIQESYKLLDNLKSENFTHQIAAQINATLKNISDYEAKRLDFLQKAGMLEGADVGDQLVEMEEKQAVLINILRNDLCPECQRVVARRLQEVTNVVEAVVVHDN